MFHRLSHNTPTFAFPPPDSAVDVMTPNWRKIHLGVSIFLLALTACAPTRPPNIGLDEVAHSLDAARDAGAPTYAPMELRNAEDHLSQARARFAKRDYDQAANLAQEAQADSELAAARARLGKVREKVDARMHENADLRQRSDAGGNPADAGGQP